MLFRSLAAAAALLVASTPVAAQDLVAQQATEDARVLSGIAFKRNVVADVGWRVRVRRDAAAEVVRQRASRAVEARGALYNGLREPKLAADEAGRAELRFKHAPARALVARRAQRAARAAGGAVGARGAQGAH